MEQREWVRVGEGIVEGGEIRQASSEFLFLLDLSCGTTYAENPHLLKRGGKKKIG